MNKLAVYLKGSQKPIIISDNDSEDLENLINEAENLFKSETVFKIGTKTDCLIGRPKEVQAVFVMTDKQNKGPEKCQ